MLNRWYRLIAINEVQSLESNFPEEMDLVASGNIALALQQLEYLDIHSSFKPMKLTLIQQFLGNQEVGLKHHINSRAVNLLKLVKQYEVANQKNILNQITKSVLDEIAAIQRAPSKEILDSSFAAALTGIKNGQMTYEGDLVLPTIKKKIETTINNYKNLKPEEWANQGF